MPKKFAVKVSRDFLKELDELTPDAALAVAETLKILELAPLPAGKNRVKKLKGITPPLYRLRAGKWRILYRIIGDEIIVLRLVSRKELERELKNMGL